MSTNGDNHSPHADGRWKFDESVTANFDQMLANSIPQYSEMRRLTYALGKRFVLPTFDVVDLGASRGEALDPFIRDGAANKFWALEISEPMLGVLRTRYAKEPKVEVQACDLRRIDENYSPFLQHRNTLVLSVLTLQFVPIEYRQRILRSVYNSLQTGGAFILVEKVLGNSADIDALFVEEYYNYKSTNGYSYEDIQRKKAALEGVLVPVTHDWNEQLLRQAGFSRIDCFYRNLNFMGILAIK